MSTESLASVSHFKKPSTGGTFRMLILDGSQFDRTKIRRLLEAAKIPCSLVEATEISELPTLLDDSDFDLILMNFFLPKGNGLQAVEHIKHHAKHRNTSMVMITGDDQSEIAVAAIKSGCMDYIPKSKLTTDWLEQAMRTILQNAEIQVQNLPYATAQANQTQPQMVPPLSQTLQPEIAYILREIRKLKADLSHPNSTIPSRVLGLETSCVKLWTSLATPEKPVDHLH